MQSNGTLPMMERPEGKEIMGASIIPLNELEKVVLQGLDIDKISDLAKCLFILNNRRFGPIPGAYLVVCTKLGEWCVGQLNADRVKPIILFEDKVFDSPELAQKEAVRLKKDRSESTPCRCT